jgi:hypothetical protein
MRKAMQSTKGWSDAHKCGATFIPRYQSIPHRTEPRLDGQRDVALTASQQPFLNNVMVLNAFLVYRTYIRWATRSS